MTEPSTAVEHVDASLDPAVARRFAAQWRESERLAATAVVPKTITHRREKDGNDWVDVPQPPEVVKATVFALVRYGAEVFGFPGPTSLARIDVIEGRLEPRYDTLLGLMLDAGHQVRVKEMTAERAEVRVRRADERDDPDGWQTFAFTAEEAEAAGYITPEPTDSRKRYAWSKAAWQTRRADMLLSKAVRRAFRFAGADTLMQRGHDDAALDGVALGEVVAEGRAAGVPVQPPADPDDEPVDAELVEDAGAGGAETGPEGGGPDTAAGAPGASRTDGDDEPVDAEIVGEGGSEASANAAAPVPGAPPSPTPMTQPQSKALHALLRSRRGAVGPTRHAVLAELLGRPITSASEVTFDEASALIDRLNDEPPFQAPEAGE